MIKTTKRLLLVMLFSVGGMLAYGQKKLTVTGIVKDNQGNIIPGATINVKGTKKSVAADVNGHFELQEVADNAVLIFSSIGFAAQESVASGNPITIILQNDEKINEAVVVTALGIKREAKAVGYSVQKVDAKDLVKVAPPKHLSGVNGQSSRLKYYSTQWC
ncbi:carboxypeptidase-like regulatory domain-containing protein [Chitinophagaceae bacterium LB-8]|uniref:Carboxypeptidase-like regulatory domain-containing protein n=1 Tax=Paraflavisolibacter caeni TaxID=2982496 RepID=A0A9X2XTW0_9BACT|nr:carboxypeptidase-like regulatory domain-containing protein [Paraflavisolibacter caeni]MCU7547578.1 carboxypeptidase-like regulatory domain-containing protein [Paraflavisolibacter caeni]